MGVKKTVCVCEYDKRAREKTDRQRHAMYAARHAQVNLCAVQKMSAIMERCETMLFNDCDYRSGGEQ